MRAVLAVWPPTTLSAASASLAYISSSSTVLVAVFLFGAFILLLDAKARFGEFKKAHREFSGSPLPCVGRISYIAHQHRTSWCSRTAITWAARLSGDQIAAETVTDYYRYLGYRWWHLTPDHTFTRNSPFLKVSFWKSGFGI